MVTAWKRTWYGRALGEASELAALPKQSGYALVIAAVGDGMIQEVTTRLIAVAGEAVVGMLGIIPLGTNNDLIKTLNLPKDWHAACATLAKGKTQRIDVGCINANVRGAADRNGHDGEWALFER